MFNNHAFRPGEVVWYTRNQSDYTRAKVAAEASQTTTIGQIILAVSARGLVQVDLGSIHHDTPQLAAYLAGLQAALVIERKTREHMSREGLVWAGKACCATKAWRDYAASEERLKGLLAPVRAADNAAMRVNQTAAKAG